MGIYIHATWGGVNNSFRCICCLVHLLQSNAHLSPCLSNSVMSRKPREHLGHSAGIAAIVGGAWAAAGASKEAAKGGGPTGVPSLAPWGISVALFIADINDAAGQQTSVGWNSSASSVNTLVNTERNKETCDKFKIIESHALFNAGIACSFWTPSSGFDSGRFSPRWFRSSTAGKQALKNSIFVLKIYYFKQNVD